MRGIDFFELLRGGFVIFLGIYYIICVGIFLTMTGKKLVSAV